ncbi:hypothetical protein [Tropicibacter oceani]|uniref:Cell wall polymerase n=1 Tax=Tropicibacter oceani TaxID=3058420 RepID=A0ABY8QG66_9RHOB|nr:hypothetical protein [Tropicibacter oceani]WGW03585.1 hypothetical protein QF118_16925 [Tropicibacter oceani]
MATISLLFLALPYFWYCLYIDRMAALDPVSELLELAVTIPASDAPEKGHVIGLVELGQTAGGDSADERHVVVLGPPDNPRIANVSSQRLIAFSYENQSLSNIDFPLSDGDVFKLAGQTYRVEITQGHEILTLFRDNRRILDLPMVYGTRQPGLATWESQSVLIGGRVPHTPDRLDSVGGLDAMRRLASLWLQGKSAPPIIVRQDNVAESSLLIKKDKTGFQLRADRGRLVTVCPKSTTQCFQLGRQPWPIADTDRLGTLKSIILGRTRYTVAHQGDRLLLTPIDREHWLKIDQVERDGLDPERRYTSQTFSPQFKRGLPPAGVQSDPPGIFAAVWGLVTTMSLPQIFLMIAIVVSAFLRNPNAPVSVTFLACAFWLWFTAISPAVTRSIGLETAEHLLFGLAVLYLLALPVLQFVFDRGNHRAIMSPHKWTAALLGLARGPRKFKPLVFITIAVLLFWLFQNLPAAQGTAGFDQATSLFDAHIAVIALYSIAFPVLIYALLVNMAGGFFLFLFWASVTIIAGLGSVGLAQQTLGNRFALNMMLYERHLAALAMLALLVIWMSVIPPRRIVDLTKWALRKGFLGHRIRRLWIGLGVITAAGAVTVFALGKTSLTFMSATAWMLGTMASDNWPPVALAALLGLIVLAGILHQRRQIVGWLVAAQKLPSMILAIPSLVLAVLVFITPETGIGGVQPSEAAKTWLAILLALILATALERKEWMLSFEKGRSLLWLFFQFFGVAAFFAVGSYVNFDMSPIVIIVAMGLVSGVCLMTFLLLSGKPMIIRGLILLCLSMATATTGIPLYVIATVAGLLFWFTGAQQGRLKRQNSVPTLSTIRASWYRGQDTFKRSAWSDTTIWLKSKSTGALFVLLALTVAFVGAGFTIKNALPSVVDTNALRTLQAKALIELPAVPQERILSFKDASLFREPDLETGLLIIEHPDLSLQVRRSRQVIAATGCGFWDNIREYTPPVPLKLEVLKTLVLHPAQNALGTLCPNYPTIFPVSGDVPLSVLAVPAIQDDFAITFLLASLGLDALPVIVLAQALMLTSMLALALNAGLRMSLYPSFRGVGLFCAVAIGNLAVILFCQFIMSWCNMLGLSAVVGQPMTFVSMGASHHLAFALPTVALTVMAGLMSNPDALQPREEKQLHSLSLRSNWGPIL